ncbi:Oidioi.mRNA.OKI2018_I69.chr2.g5484.t1.cds [Oikopleura dioica]|uniref:Oidioi.mRNA.OKI2018_I69.XSR.g14846.t1.cds n=1 Tax=Oikopleura dioica TaxID=34765 RepID=A0ABN7SEW4_OIKDI|nr:Oidioi.mRNA.OKI2018_I69.XSR.g14846.t1.cds [Oikopleura dioica]CAG5111150.1 Oidioi.mRNA.OKI2018_I69.chr2.g5484.t1.cds [Oikopleura dioica]
MDCDIEKETYISECIPLFHQGISLKPMFQVAMRTVEDYCERNNLAIAGYYESPEIVKSATPSQYAEKVGDKLREQFKDAFLLHNIWQEDSKFALRPFVKESGKWVYSSNKLSFENENVFKTVAQLHKADFCLELQDFDCYLDNFTNDWTNRSLQEVIMLVDAQTEHQDASIKAK